jgi:hypothetical protein
LLGFCLWGKKRTRKKGEQLAYLRIPPVEKTNWDNVSKILEAGKMED